MKNPSRLFTNPLIRPSASLPGTIPSSCVGIVRFGRTVAISEGDSVFNFAGSSRVGSSDGKMPEAARVSLGHEGAASGRNRVGSTHGTLASEAA